MNVPSPGALTAYGWSPRVEALYRTQQAPDTARPGRVTRVERGAVVVADATGAEHPHPPHPAAAVGDWVVLDGGRLAAVVPRWSSLDRQAPEAGTVQVLAANVDLVLVAVPADRPSLARVEREVLLAWESGARPVVVLTKADLAPAGLLESIATRVIGVEVVATSTAGGGGVAEVASLCAPDRTAALLGPSGAGKSSLTNALLRQDRQATGGVRQDDRRGRHTTSARSLLPLPGGGVVIDTPGLRSLGLVGGEQVDRAFPDIDELAAGCRFGDCAHGGEPGCAVTTATAEGGLSEDRLASYRKLVREAAAERARANPVARRDAERAWKQRAKDARQHDKRRPPPR